MFVNPLKSFEESDDAASEIKISRNNIRLYSLLIILSMTLFMMSFFTDYISYSVFGENYTVTVLDLFSEDHRDGGLDYAAAFYIVGMLSAYILSLIFTGRKKTTLCILISMIGIMGMTFMYASVRSESSIYEGYITFRMEPAFYFMIASGATYMLATLFYLQKQDHKSEKHFCPVCGECVSNTMRFCSECGNSLISKKTKCENCGFECGDDNYNFCPVCGMKLNSEYDFTNKKL